MLQSLGLAQRLKRKDSGISDFFGCRLGVKVRPGPDKVARERAAARYWTGASLPLLQQILVLAAVARRHRLRCATGQGILCSFRSRLQVSFSDFFYAYFSPGPESTADGRAARQGFLCSFRHLLWTSDPEAVAEGHRCQCSFQMQLRREGVLLLLLQETLPFWLLITDGGALLSLLCTGLNRQAQGFQRPCRSESFFTLVMLQLMQESQICHVCICMFFLSICACTLLYVEKYVLSYVVLCVYM